LDYGKYQNGFASKISLAKRKEIFSKLEMIVKFSELDSVLDVGVTANKKHIEDNFFEEYYPKKDQITALSDQNAAWLEQKYPGLKFVPADGRDMPFRDRSFDLVFSSAVIEHVGALEQQRIFLKECCRVSKKYVFLTTPNRWFPVEFHTVLPFLHWLPKNFHRKLLYRFKFHEFASEENLNLLGRSDLVKLIDGLQYIGEWEIFGVKLMGIISNLILFIKVAQLSQ
jgi:hypothetical protein